MELVDFLASCEALRQFYVNCSQDEQRYLDAVAIVAGSKLSYTAKLLALGEGVEKILRQRRNL